MSQRHTARWVLPIALSLAAMLLAACGTKSATNPLESHLLTVSDLPSGWHAAPVDLKSVQVSHSTCFSGLPDKPEGYTYKVAAFYEGSSLPSFSEVVANGPKAASTWTALNSALAGCKEATLEIAGKKVSAKIAPLTLGKLGASSTAYTWTLTFSGIPLVVDQVIYEAGDYVGYISFSDLPTPEDATVSAFARAAIAKMKNRTVSPISSGVSVASAPVHTVATSMGKVAYRSVGTGTPLIMIAGYNSSMEVWDRRFVDALARNRRVIVFDNAGIGGTKNLSPLTIDAMANQTAALIKALGLGKVDVLGWSMGSMIAQALTVLHPGDVSRLILCSAFPGDGTAVAPSRAVLSAFEAATGTEGLKYLFPADQTAAQTGYVTSLGAYPDIGEVPTRVATSQRSAVDDWWAGKDAAGLRAGEIRAPTLVADGTLDKLDPQPNSEKLAQSIPGATLKLYPDAAHAFLFQEPGFASLVDKFLG